MTEAEEARLRSSLADLRQKIALERAKLANLQASVRQLQEAADEQTSAQAGAVPLTRVRDLGQSAALGELRSQIEAARSELIELDDSKALQQVGIYEYHHPLENADAYKEQLSQLRQRMKAAIRERSAVLTSDRFAFNNSLAQGRRMTADLAKLMLRSYNAEAENSLRALRAGNLQAAVKRLEASREAIAKLGGLMEMRISPEYHEIRLDELRLTADYQFRIQEEREEAREERERLREQRRAEQELAAERERLEKERGHYLNALRAVRERGQSEEIAELEHRLRNIDEAISTNDYRAANIRAGYVYVISNVGAFGPGVVKIGMTRRLEPLDRVRELGDASVPFPFDVHAIYFSDDALGLESSLHQYFETRRLNRVNQRREFFFATPLEVLEVLRTKVGSLLDFSETPEADQYFQSRSLWPSSSSRGAGPQ